MTLCLTRPAVLAFDLDDTLAPSKSPMDKAMAALLADLLRHTTVCVISGGTYEQFERQVLTALPRDERLAQLHLMPTCGTRYYRWEDAAWECVYAHDLTAEEKARALAALEAGAVAHGLWPDHPYGPVVEDRGSQLTFSALGQLAPAGLKRDWDPDGRKKELLRAYAAARLPDLEVRSGGSTSVDVTRRGVDKAFGISRLAETLGVGFDDIVFVGDRLDEGGNDYPVCALGVRCVPVHGPADTAALVSGWLTAWAAVGTAGPTS